MSGPLELQLFWPRDVDGYDIKPYKPTKKPKPRSPYRRVGLLEPVVEKVRKPGRRASPAPVKTILESAVGPPPTWIVARAKRASESRDVLQIEDVIWRRLADTKPNAQGALDFVSDFGFLRSMKGRESVGFICEQIEVMRSVVDAIDRKDWTVLRLWLIDNRKAIGLNPEARMEEDRPEPILFYRPDTLLDALYLQALQDAWGGAEFIKCDCPGCPKYLRVGPGTGHTRISRARRYCEPACQKSHAYMIKKGEVT